MEGAEHIPQVSKIRLQVGLQQVEKITTGTDEVPISNSPDEVDPPYEQETVPPTPDGSAVPDDGRHEGGETGSDETAPPPDDGGHAPPPDDGVNDPPEMDKDNGNNNLNINDDDLLPEASGVSTSDADPAAVYETSSIATERGKGAIAKESNKTSSRIGNSLPIITLIFLNWM